MKILAYLSVAISTVTLPACHEHFVFPVSPENEAGYSTQSLIVMEFGTELNQVDGRSVSTNFHNEPPYILLEPDRHTFSVRYVHLSGMNGYLGAQGELDATLEPGHTYVIRNKILHVDGKSNIRFWLEDYGYDFPNACLSILLNKTTEKTGGKRRDSNLASCRDSEKRKRLSD